MAGSGTSPLDAETNTASSSNAGANTPSAGSTSVAGAAAAGSGGMSAAAMAGSGGTAPAAGAPGNSDPRMSDAAVPPAADASMPAAAEPCTKPSSYMKGSNRMTLEHQGRMRKYVVYVPSSLDPMLRSPLVLDFHGNTSSASQEQSGSGWQQKAD
jgi:hypothetical protein